jgi:hypothetical protein
MVQQRPGIPYSDLNLKYDILGNTDRPLGEMLTVRGKVVASECKGDEYHLLVNWINGMAPKPYPIPHQSYSYRPEAYQSLKIGKMYELRGYEQGWYQAMLPREVLMDPARPVPQSRGPGFYVGFVVLAAREIAAVPPQK